MQAVREQDPERGDGVTGVPGPHIERASYMAANKDPLLALWLVLAAIWRGELTADRRGVHRVA